MNMCNLTPRTTSPVSSLREGSNPYRATHTHTHTHTHTQPPPILPTLPFLSQPLSPPTSNLSGELGPRTAGGKCPNRSRPWPAFPFRKWNGIILSVRHVTSWLFIPAENCLIYVSTFTFTLSDFISLYFYFGLICHLISTARLILLMCERNDPVEMVSDLSGIVPMILFSNHHLPLRTPPASSSYLLQLYPLDE